MLATRLERVQKIDLDRFDPDGDESLSREEADARLPGLLEELNALQELLYAAGTHSLLVVLQGRDTAGKDGTLKAVAGAMNPVGVRIASFKVPTATELAHDFLWRIHAQTPARGETVFFNRSHYEDVLVVRTHKLVPESVWKARYEHINAFEANLADSGVIIAKFYLHISKEEQKERLLAREEDAEKAWKLNPVDWQERKLWDDYTAAYEDALGNCSCERAPWFLVPADKKWLRNVAVAEALVSVLQPYKDGWKKRLSEIGEKQKAALAALPRKE